MRLFGSTKKKSTVLSPEMAAATLAACVMTDAETNGMPELDDVQLRSFGTLLHLTKAAIITNWLRTLVERLSGPQRLRASSILKEFELVMYGDAPNDEAKQLAAELARLTKQTTKLIQILENKTLPELKRAGKRSVGAKNGSLLSLRMRICSNALASFTARFWVLKYTDRSTCSERVLRWLCFPRMTNEQKSDYGVQRFSAIE